MIQLSKNDTTKYTKNDTDSQIRYLFEKSALCYTIAIKHFGRNDNKDTR